MGKKKKWTWKRKLEALKAEKLRAESHKAIIGKMAANDATQLDALMGAHQALNWLIANYSGTIDEIEDELTRIANRKKTK